MADSPFTLEIVYRGAVTSFTFDRALVGNPSRTVGRFLEKLRSKYNLKGALRFISNVRVGPETVIPMDLTLLEAEQRYDENEQDSAAGAPLTDAAASAATSSSVHSKSVGPIALASFTDGVPAFDARLAELCSATTSDRELQQRLVDLQQEMHQSMSAVNHFFTAWQRQTEERLQAAALQQQHQQREYQLFQQQLAEEQQRVARWMSEQQAKAQEAERQRAEERARRAREAREPCPDWTRCQLQADTEHMALYMHRCPHGVECSQYDNPEHTACYQHPCLTDSQRSGQCPDSSAEHRKRYRHQCVLQACRVWRSDPLHAVRQEHVCRDWPCLARRHDAEHVRIFSHPPLSYERELEHELLVVKSLLVCDLDARCTDESNEHRDRFAHTCRFGQRCVLLSRRDATGLRHAGRYLHPHLHSATAAAAAGGGSGRAASGAGGGGGGGGGGGAAVAAGATGEVPLCALMLDCPEFQRYIASLKRDAAAPAAGAGAAPAGPAALPAHLRSARHPCPRGLECLAFVHDLEHARLFLHLCPFMPCDLRSDEQHRKLLLHLCPVPDCPERVQRDHATACLHMCTLHPPGTPCNAAAASSPLDRFFLRHRCPNSSCAQQSDGLHMLQHLHACSMGADCPHAQSSSLLAAPGAAAAAAAAAGGVADAAGPTTVTRLGGAPAPTSRVHMMAYTHPCPAGAACRQQGDFLHRLLLDHSGAGAAPGAASHMLPGEQVLTRAECDRLKVTAASWQSSPRHPVVVTLAPGTPPEPGYLLGWEVVGFGQLPKRTGKLVVWVNRLKRPEVVPAADVAPANPADPVRGPWHGAVKVSRLPPAAQAVMDRVLRKQVDGCRVTYEWVLQELAKQHITALVVGGAVRDCVRGLPDTAIHDIDISFDADPTHLYEVLKRLPTGGKAHSPGPNGLVALGDRSNGRQLEGKMFMGFNADVLRWSPYEVVCSQPDLTYELLARDFCLNALFYDPINRVVIDITGRGLTDAAAMRLRIPVDPAHWSQWADANPTKLLRYFSLLARGYQSADDDGGAMRRFIAERMRKWFLCPTLSNAAACAAHQAQCHPNVRCFLDAGTLQIRVRGIVHHDQAQYRAMRDQIRRELGDAFVSMYFDDRMV